MRRIVELVLLAGAVAANVQQPFLFQNAQPDEYQFEWPIKKVAIIGAGPSGLIAYQELTEAGLDVRIFERDSVPGGNWHYTEEVPLDAPVPNAPTPISDFVPSLPPANVELPYSEEFENDGQIWKDHTAPKPIWEAMTCTLPSPVQQFPQWPWPAGTPWELTQYQVRNYVRSYASYLNINSNDENPAAAYNTRVERVEKRVNEAGQEQGWRLWLRSLKPTEKNTYRATWWTENFDAVVVAVGKFYAPSMPSIPGLEEWVRRFPSTIRHSRQYRRPEVYANQTVLIIGASNSGIEFSRALNRHARKIYQSIRPGSDSRLDTVREKQRRRIPENTIIIGEIEEFLPLPGGSPIQSGLVKLKNGTTLSGIDSVILATGFRYSFPFLPQYYDDAPFEPHVGSAPAVSPFLPLNGLYVRDLYLDQFYIQDPTLAFIGVTKITSTFTYPSYAALALAKVWTNTAKLPSGQTMQARYEQMVGNRGGYGKHLMFLGPRSTSACLDYLIGWLNSAAAKYGGKQIDGLPKGSEEIRHYWSVARFREPIQSGRPTQDDGVLASLRIPTGKDADQGGYDSDLLFYEGDW